MDKEKIGLWVIYASLSCTLVLILQIVIGNISFGSSGMWSFLKDLSATIISLVAMIVAIFNVKEVRKQREKMYEPRLVFQASTWNTNSGDIAPSLCIRNIGYGSAVNLKITWDYSSVINGDTKYISSFKDEFFVYKSVLFKKNSESNFEYILPVSIEEKSENVSLPLVCIYQLLGKIEDTLETVKNNNKGSFNFDRSTILMLAEYADINGEIKKEKFEVSIELSFFVNNQIELLVKSQRVY